MERDELAKIHSFCSSSSSGYFPRLPILSLLSKSPDDWRPFSPPLSKQVSVPFQWEDVPGKPKPFYAATLEMDGFVGLEDQMRLPPRLYREEEEEEDTISPLSELISKQLIIITNSESDSLGGKAKGICIDETKKKKNAMMKSKRPGFSRFFQRKFRTWVTVYQSFKRMGSGCSCRL